MYSIKPIYLIFIMMLLCCTPVLGDASKDKIDDLLLSKRDSVTSIARTLMSQRTLYMQEILKTKPEPSASKITRSDVEDFIIESIKKSRALDFASQFGKKMPYANFGSLQIKGATFEGMDLTGADFTETGIVNTKFSKCILDQARFSSVTMDGVVFEDCSIKMTQFNDSDFDNVVIRRSDISVSTFKNVYANALTLQNVNGVFTAFVSSGIRRSNFIDSALKYMIFDNTEILSSNINKLYAPFIAIIGSSVKNTYIYNSYLHSGVFHADSIRQTNFNNTTLSNSMWNIIEAHDMDVTSCKLENANMLYVDASNANWSHSQYNDMVTSNSGFSNVNLSWSDLSGAKFEKTKFDNCVFRESFALNNDWHDVELSGVWWDDSDFSRLRATKLRMLNSAVSTSSLENINLERATFYDSKFIKNSFYKAEMPRVKFKNSKIMGSSLIAANMRGAWFMNSEITQHVALLKTDLTNATFYKSKLNTLNARDATWYNTAFIKSQFTNTIFDDKKVGRMLLFDNQYDSSTSRTFTEGKAITSKELFMASLSNNNDYSGITLVDVDLSNLNLSNINLSSAHLLRVDLKGTDLAGANLSEAVINDVKQGS